VDKILMTRDKSETPLVSVMLCTNQADSYFDLALASLQNQSLRNIEILVVANGLTPKQTDQLKDKITDPRVRVFQTDMSGVTFSRNLTLHEARADLIAVLDADDIAYPDRLRKQYAFLTCHPEVMVVGSNYDTIDADGLVLSTSQLPSDNQAIRNSLVRSNPLCHPATMFRRQAALTVGGYSGGLAQDYELWVRLLSNSNNKFANLPEPLIGYRIPAVSKARRSLRAYAQVASAQWRQFVMTKQIKWCVASIVSAGKAWLRSRQG
jgi:glycosyltransferase involved in cell wall biosynthesis